MKQAPNLWPLHSLTALSAHAETNINGKWVPARPTGLHSITYRVRLAWGVFVGKYDAVRWPGGQ